MMLWLSVVVAFDDFSELDTGNIGHMGIGFCAETEASRALFVC